MPPGVALGFTSTEAAPVKLFIAVLMSLFCATAQAQWTDKSGNRIPNADDQKSNGRFIAQLNFVTNEQEFFKKWGVKLGSGLSMPCQ